MLKCFCACPLQEWPSPSWCCWPVWTHVPTRGSTQLSPAACPESCRACCSVGRDPAAGAPFPMTPPPRTPPPPRTACTDRDWCDREWHTVTCLKRHAWVHTRPVARTCCCTLLGHHQRLQRVLTSTRCFPQQRTAVLSTGPLSLITCPLHPSRRRAVIEDVNTLLWGHCGIYCTAAVSDSICNAKWPWE